MTSKLSGRLPDVLPLVLADVAAPLVSCDAVPKAPASFVPHGAGTEDLTVSELTEHFRALALQVEERFQNALKSDKIEPEVLKLNLGDIVPLAQVDKEICLWGQDRTVSKLISRMMCDPAENAALTRRMRIAGKTIRKLCLSNVELVQDQLEKLPGIFPKIEKFSIRASVLEIDALALNAFKGLQSLHLSSCKGVDDEVIARIGVHRTITSLTLRRTQVGDETLAAVSKWPNLLVLDVGNTFCTDTGLSSLAGHKKLQELRLVSCRSKSTDELTLPIKKEVGEVGIYYDNIVPGVTSAGFRDFVTKCTSLKKVDVFGCSISEADSQFATGRKIVVINSRNKLVVRDYEWGGPIGKCPPSHQFACYAGFDFKKDQVLLSQILSMCIAYDNLSVFLMHFEKEIRDAGPHIQFLELRNSKYDSTPCVVTQYTVQLLAEKFPNVQRIVISQLGRYPSKAEPIKITLLAVEALQNFRKLVELDFSGYPHEEIDDTRFAKALIACESLQSLNFNQSNIPDTVLIELTACKSLKKVDISNCDYIEDSGFQIFASNCSTLEHIICMNCNNISEETIETVRGNKKLHVQTFLPLNGNGEEVSKILKSVYFNLTKLPPALLQHMQEVAPSITSLDFDDLQVEAQDLKNLAELFKNLESLSFTETSFEPNTFKPLKFFLRLRKLDLSHAKDLTTDDFIDIAVHQGLECVVLKGTNVTEKDFARVVAKCRALKEIDVSGCPLIGKKIRDQVSQQDWSKYGRSQVLVASSELEIILVDENEKPKVLQLKDPKATVKDCDEKKSKAVVTVEGV
jgi:Leucine-rich repeat (LRR) protein